MLIHVTVFVWFLMEYVAVYVCVLGSSFVSKSSPFSLFPILLHTPSIIVSNSFDISHKNNLRWWWRRRRQHCERCWWRKRMGDRRPLPQHYIDGVVDDYDFCMLISNVSLTIPVAIFTAFRFFYPQYNRLYSKDPLTCTLSPSNVLLSSFPANKK